MRVKVLFFGMLKDIAGVSEDTLELAGTPDLAAVFAHYSGRFPRLADYSKSIVLARNQQFCPPQTPLADGDEIAFLPPVSGGSGPYLAEIRDAETGNFFALTRQPIDAPALRDRLLQGCDGAYIVFEGVVRDNTKGRRTLRLDYECYEAMALPVMARIGREIAASHPISRIAIVHRLGLMEIGEASVVIAVSSPHRRAAYEASLEGINRLKKTVPIWKKEFFADGEVWVEGEWDESVPRAAGS